jgi:hypothetical protein
MAHTGSEFTHFCGTHFLSHRMACDYLTPEFNGRGETTKNRRVSRARVALFALRSNELLDRAFRPAPALPCILPETYY